MPYLFDHHYFKQNMHTRLFTPFMRCTLSCFLCFFCLTTAIFAQNTANTSANSSEKFIFYWGEIQANLWAKDNYQTEIKTTYNAFRKSVFNQPSIWNGKSLVRVFQYTIGDVTIKADTLRDVYSALIPDIDQKIGRSIKTGDTIFIKDITLGEGTNGHFTIILESPNKKPPAPGRDIFLQPFMEELYNIESLQWGPVFSTKSLAEKKEFYTVKDLEATLRAMPIMRLKNDSLLPQTTLTTHIFQDNLNLNKHKM